MSVSTEMDDCRVRFANLWLQPCTQRYSYLNYILKVEGGWVSGKWRIAQSAEHN